MKRHSIEPVYQGAQSRQSARTRLWFDHQAEQAVYLDQFVTFINFFALRRGGATGGSLVDDPARLALQLGEKFGECLPFG